MMPIEKFFDIAQDLEVYHGIFSRIWQMGRPVEDKTIPTAAIRFNRDGGFFSFCFNPDYYNSLDEYNLKFTICHEALHVILNHGYRSYGLEPKLANVAMDVVINECLVNNFGFNRAMIKNEKDLCWYDTVFEPKDNIEKEKSFEYYYDALYTKIINQAGGADYDENGDVEMPKGSGKPNKNKTVDVHDGFGSEDQDQIDQKLDDACDRLSNTEKNKLKEMVDKILDDASKNQLSRGTSAGGLTKIMNIEKVKIKRKWETVIKKWAEQYLRPNDKNHEQWARINRRFVTLSKDMFIPTEMEIDSYADKKHRIKVMFFLDTSGSCVHLAERFFKAAKTLPPDRFDIVLHCFDTNVYETSLKTGQLYGFGGTSFDIIEEYIQKYRKEKNNNKYPDAVFIITDGMGNNVHPEFPKKWFWFLSEDYRYCIPPECNIFKLNDYE
jgi:predicted metal-dependent peptidase